MASAIDNLTARRDAICAELAAMVGPDGLAGPNHSGEHAVDRVGYRDSLYRELAEIDRQLRTLVPPAEVVSYGLV